MGKRGYGWGAQCPLKHRKCGICFLIMVLGGSWCLAQRRNFSGAWALAETAAVPCLAKVVSKTSHTEANRNCQHIGKQRSISLGFSNGNVQQSVIIWPSYLVPNMRNLAVAGWYYGCFIDDIGDIMGTFSRLKTFPRLHSPTPPARRDLGGNEWGKGMGCNQSASVWDSASKQKKIIKGKVKHYLPKCLWIQENSKNLGLCPWASEGDVIQTQGYFKGKEWWTPLVAGIPPNG